MFLGIIAFISLMIVIILHELGHFVLAKKFGVRVDEFGVGFPPRLFGKKFGETLYSVNLLPFGAFVRIFGEEGETGPGSFSQKPIWQRSLIVLGGVIVFWIVAAILLSIVMGLGANIAISDEDNSAQNPKVQITALSPTSPALLAGLKAGDSIISITSSDNQNYAISKVKEIQQLTENYKGQELIFTVERGKEILNIAIKPRVSPPQNEGPLGVSLMRTTIKSYPWYIAPLEGIKATWNLTVIIFQGWIQALSNVFQRQQQTEVQLMGPIGIFSTFVQVGQLGVAYFLQFIALISIHLALFNILPIPVVDGGRLFFLFLEAIRKKPINLQLEQKINMVFFSLLIFMMIWVTIKDVIRLF